MADLSYTMLASLDGFIEDEEGLFDWAEPDEEVHAFINDLERAVGTHLYGRRLYETLRVWETLDLNGLPAYIRDYAEIWRAADKIVYSRSLERPSTSRTSIERDFDPEAIRRMKGSARRELAVGGAELATVAFEAGLVDECRLFLAPVAVGGGKRALPAGLRLDLELLEERRFSSGMVYVRYRVRP